MDERLSDPRHQRLLEWELTAPASRSPQTQTELAAQLGVSARTLRDWKERMDFQAAWKAAFQEMAGSMERTKALLDSLYADSLNADNDKRVTAAKLYWDISRAIAPPEPDVRTSLRAQELSTAELVALLSEAAFAELESRGLIVGGV